MSTSSGAWVNQCLPVPVMKSLSEDDAMSWRETMAALDALEAMPEEVFEPRVLGKAVRLVMSRMWLKYEIDVKQRSRVAQVFLNAYKRSAMTLPGKNKILAVVNMVLKKKLAYDIQLDWKSLWDEMVAIATREKKTAPLASETIMATLLSRIKELLYLTRHLVKPVDAEAIIKVGMRLLADTRDPRSCEGLFLMVTVMPTKYDKYDTLVSGWVDTWLTKSHNVSWDLCWLILLCRARKHTTSFDWTALHPTLLNKLKEILALPNAGGGSKGTSFPSYYRVLLPKRGDARQLALNKITKIIYFTSCTGPMVMADPIPVLPPKLPSVSEVELPGLNTSVEVHQRALDLWLFLQSIRMFFYPSNTGAWTSKLATFISALVHELAKHVSGGLLAKVYGPDKLTKSSKPTLHLGTTRYLSACLFTLVLEGIYGKDPGMHWYCVNCLQNLLTIDSDLGKVVLPVFVDALGTGSINQAHQAPAAMGALVWTFKQFLFPRPIMLPHLNELLTLSLQGIDCNDDTKTFATLNMYSAMLLWLPLRDDYSLSDEAAAKPIHASFLQIVTGNASGETWGDYAPVLSTLGSQISVWALSCLDRILELCEKFEEPKEGQKRRGVSMVIENVVQKLFSACVSTNLRARMEEKVISYVKTVKPNAAKEFAKIINSIVVSNPASFTTVLTALADEDTMEGTSSKEKMAFRLRLIAGATRNASDEATKHLPVLEKLISFSTTSTEKEVRKEACRLLKDVLRGLSAYYFVTPAPVYAPDDDLFLANCRPLSDMGFHWNVPSKAAVEAATSLLRVRFDASVAEVTSLLKAPEAHIEDKTGGVKAVEEKLVAHLEVVRACLRGAAEILGNGAFAKDDDTLHTGKSITTVLSESDQEYLRDIRGQGLAFVVECNRTIDSPECPTALVPLQDSEQLRKCLLQVVSVLIIKRMAFVKAPNDNRKQHNTSKKFVRTVVTQCMIRWTKKFGAMSGGGAADSRIFGNITRAQLSCTDLWKGFDYSVGYKADRVAIQHATRLREYSYASTHAALREDRTRELYMTALQQVVALAGHEYDTIRSEANNVFRNVSGRFGWHLNQTLTDMIAAICTPGVSFSIASGAIQVLQFDRVMRRIADHWNLCGAFLSAVLRSQNMIAAVPESDKRQKLMAKVGNLLASYTQNFHHMPSPVADDVSLLPSAIRRATLEALGIADDEWAPKRTPKPLEGGGGLRYDAFAAYTVLHLVGHSRDRVSTAGEWTWSIAFVTQAHGEPTQMLALAGLIKLAYTAFEHGTSQETLEQLSAAFGSASSAPLWKEFLNALAHHGHPRVTGDLQPPRGVGALISSSAYLLNVVPRAALMPSHDGALFSGYVRREYMAAITALVCLASGHPSGRVVSLEVAQMVLQLSQELSHTSQEELRANNVLQAEVFGGICRAAALLDAGTDRHAIFALLDEYLFGLVGKASIDYSKDFAEALAYGLGGMTVSLDNPLCAAILTRLRKFGSTASRAAATVSTNEEDGENNEGFAREVKELSMVCAMLYADMHCSVNSDAPSAITEVARVVLDIFADPMCYLLASHYQSSRHIIAKIISRLAYASAGAVDLLPIARRLTDIASEEPMEAASPDEMAPGREPEEAGALKSTPSKRAIDTAVSFVHILLAKFEGWRFAAVLPALFEVCVQGAAHPDINFAKESARACVELCSKIRASGTPDIVKGILNAISAKATHPSWHARQTVIICATSFLGHNMLLLTVDEKKQVRDIFTAAFHDSHPEVQMLAQAGMVIYLLGKPMGELEKLAGAYEKNCTVLADRERRRKKAAGESGSVSAPDKNHVVTVMMASCLILSFPYDVPSFVPSLLVALIRHATNTHLKATVVKCVQDFKRTHQDRWAEFKTKFSSMQLEDLQGAGAATYFS